MFVNKQCYIHVQLTVLNKGKPKTIHLTNNSTGNKQIQIRIIKFS